MITVLNQKILTNPENKPNMDGTHSFDTKVLIRCTKNTDHNRTKGQTDQTPKSQVPSICTTTDALYASNRKRSKA